MSAHSERAPSLFQKFCANLVQKRKNGIDGAQMPFFSERSLNYSMDGKNSQNSQNLEMKTIFRIKLQR